MNSPYPDEVWRLFRETPRAGSFAANAGSLRAEARTHAADFRIRLECTLAAQTISDSRFLAYGCPFTIAVGAWLAQWCTGRNKSDLIGFSAAELRAALEIPEDRAHCWLMAQDVLRAMSEQMS